MPRLTRSVSLKVWRCFTECLVLKQGLSRIRRGFFDAQAQEIVRLPMPQEPLAPSSIFEHLFKHDNELLKYVFLTSDRAPMANTYC